VWFRMEHSRRVNDRKVSVIADGSRIVSEGRMKSLLHNSLIS
jgi:hypothetical protein